MLKSDTTIAESALRGQSRRCVSKVASSDVLAGASPSAVELAARSGVVARHLSNSGFAKLAQRD